MNAGHVVAGRRSALFGAFSLLSGDYKAMSALRVPFVRADAYSFLGVAEGARNWYKSPCRVRGAWFHVSHPTQRECSMRASLTVVAIFIGTLFAVGCSQMSSPTVPTSASSAPSLTSSSIASVSSSGTLTALGRAVTDETLANAGWSCIQPGNGLTLCFPPGGGVPSIPPLPDNGGAPTYTFMAFTLDHQFVHRVTLRRADLYHGEPCLGGAPWNYLAFLNYYECINQA